MKDACGIAVWECLTGSGSRFLALRREIKDGVRDLGVIKMPVKVEVLGLADL